MKLFWFRRVVLLLGLGLGIVFFAEGQNYRLPLIPIEQTRIEVLDNGLTIATTPHDAVPNVFVRVQLLNSPDDQWYNLLGNLSFRWLCKGSDSVELEQRLNGWMANVVPDGRGFSVNGPSRFASELLNLTADLLLHPSLDSLSFQSVLGEWQQQSRLAMEDPQTISRKVAEQWLFSGALNIMDWLDDAAKTTALRQACEAYIREFIQPNHLLISVVGDSGHNLPDSALQNWRKGSDTIVQIPALPALPGPAVALVQQPGRTTFLQLMIPLEIQPGSKAAVALEVLQTLFAGFPGSTLNRQLMRDFKMPLGMLSGISSWNGREWFMASGQLPNRDVPVIAGLVMDRLMSLKTNPIPEELVQQGKNWLIRLHQRKLEQPAELAAMLTTTREGNYDFGFHTNYIELLNSITSADLVQVANRFLLPERLYVIAVGEVKPVAAALSALDADGLTDWFNSLGKPIDPTFFDIPEGVTATSLLNALAGQNMGTPAQTAPQSWYLNWTGSLDGTPVVLETYRSGPSKLGLKVTLDGVDMHRIEGEEGRLVTAILGEQQDLDPLTQQLLELQPLLFPSSLPNWRDFKANLDGVLEIEGQKIVVLQLETPKGFAFTAYLDAETKLLSGLKKSHSGGQFESWFFDYAPNKGAMLPRRVVIKGIGPYPLTFTLHDFQTNEQADLLRTSWDK